MALICGKVIGRRQGDLPVTPTRAHIYGHAGDCGTCVLFVTLAKAGAHVCMSPVINMEINPGREVLSKCHETHRPAR